jgi:hypothetical protein
MKKQRCSRAGFASLASPLGSPQVIRNYLQMKIQWRSRDVLFVLTSPFGISLGKVDV